MEHKAPGSLRGTLPVRRKRTNMEKVIDGHRQCPSGNLNNHFMLQRTFRAPSQCPGELVLVLCEHSGSFYCSSETLEPLRKEDLCYSSDLSSISPS